LTVLGGELEAYFISGASAHVSPVASDQAASCGMGGACYEWRRRTELSFRYAALCLSSCRHTPFSTSSHHHQLQGHRRRSFRGWYSGSCELADRRASAHDRARLAVRRHECERSSLAVGWPRHQPIRIQDARRLRWLIGRSSDRKSPGATYSGEGCVLYECL